jgi:ADP-ribosylglycohydrolase
VIAQTAPKWALDAAEAAGDSDGIGKLGLACPIPQALPAVLWLVKHHGHDFELASIENAMAGGDNCARALVLGMLLGATHGLDAIPLAWREGLLARKELHSFLTGQ